MPDVVIADPNLITLLNNPAQNTDSSYLLGQAGLQGDAFVLDDTTDPWSWVKADAGGTVKAGSKDRGILLTAGAVGQSCVIAKKGARVSFNNALTQGRYYYISVNSGKITDTITEITTGNIVTLLGYAETNDIMIIFDNYTGVLVL